MLAKVAYVPQEPEPWTGRLREHLSLILALHGVTGRKNDEKTNEVLKSFEIESLAGSRWEQISGGQRARCAFALALAPEPRLVIMDEPMASLDPRSRRWMLDKLQSLAKGAEPPIGFLVSSHLVVELESVATHVRVLEDGRLLDAAELELAKGLVIDLVTEQPWRATEALQRSLALEETQVKVETLPDARQVRITLPSGTGRAAVLAALSEQGITPAWFVDLTGSVARKS